MKTIYYFFWLLNLRYRKTPMHPTVYCYLRHAWRLAKELNREINETNK
jgi:hypothetical protein